METAKWQSPNRPVGPAFHDPFSIVPLGSLDALVPKQLGHFLERDAFFQKIHRERIPQAVTHHVPAIFNFRGLETRCDVILCPISCRAFFLALTIAWRVVASAAVETRTVCPRRFRSRLATTRKLEL